MRRVFSNPLERLCDGLLYEIRHDAQMPHDYGFGVPDHERVKYLAATFLCAELRRPGSTLPSWVLANSDFERRGRSEWENYWIVVMADERWRDVPLDPRLTPRVLGHVYATLLDVLADIREDGW